MSLMLVVYKDLIISTIVDIITLVLFEIRVYKDLIISTIVDFSADKIPHNVYKDLIISTIVDGKRICFYCFQSIRT